MSEYKYHFTPAKGWTNDPNGTIYIDGEYHLFYQHYPDNTIWGPMHWGHAVSKDLINWTHKNIAIYPDENGYIFSGSCIYTEDFQGKPAILAFYTSHNSDSGEQQQCLAYSFDFENFEKYEGNPIIKNPKTSEDFQQDFRDPKVFKNPVKKGFSMVLAVGKMLRFYYSEDFINWDFTGEFDPSIKGFGGICECPDCFPLSCNNKEYWILTLSSILPEEKIGNNLANGEYPYAHVMQYFVGNFDGENFKCVSDIDEKRNQLINNMFGADISDKKPLVLDYGLDNYAMVTYVAAPQARALMMGWGECWEYVNDTPVIKNKQVRGKMTLARTAELTDTPWGYRLRFDIPSDIPCDSFELTDGQSITLYGDNGKPLVITIADGKIWVLRKSSEVTDKHNSFFAHRIYDGICKFKVYKDDNYFEIFAEDGVITFSVMVY